MVYVNANNRLMYKYSDILALCGKTPSDNMKRIIGRIQRIWLVNRAD
jgi:hypothetical protein